MRDFQCGHANLQTPRVLRNATGRGRIVVDVGLDEGDETLDAVESGFVVFGFEMLMGSMEKIRLNAVRRGIVDRVHFVNFVFDAENKMPVAKDLPPPPEDGGGYAYVFNAGLSDKLGSMDTNMRSNSVEMMTDNGAGKQWSEGKVPILRLDQALPPWVDDIFFLKIDTQGHELKVLNGAAKFLENGSVQYAQYEFSPKLMRTSRSGDPLELLNMMVNMGAVCFDMMTDDVHHRLTRPSKPLSRYYESLNGGRNSPHHSARNNYMTDVIGPWDDILCWFPDATA